MESISASTMSKTLLCYNDDSEEVASVETIDELKNKINLYFKLDSVKLFFDYKGLVYIYSDDMLGIAKGDKRRLSKIERHKETRRQLK